MAAFDWYGWGGAAGGAVVANYFGTRVRPVISSISNANLAKYAYIAAQVFQIGTRRSANMGEAIDGASEWAVGDLIGTALSHRLGLSAVVSAPVVTHAPTTVTTPVATSGPVGVPASGGSGAFDLPVPGY